MAKIFSTEQLSLDGDKIRIKTAGSANTVRITSSDGNSVYFRETDVSSLHGQDSENKAALGADITTLSTLESNDKVAVDSSITTLSTLESNDKVAVDSSIVTLSTLESNDKVAVDSSIVTNVSSLHDQDSENKAALGADITTLSTLESNDKVALDDSISVINASLTENDVYAAQPTVTLAATSITVDYTSVGFATAPAVVGTLMSTDASDPIIGVMLEGAPTTGEAKFVFSDEIPSSNYKLDILAAV